METNIFSWENYKILRNLRVCFYACTLKKDLFIQGQAIGWFGGAKIEEIEVDYLHGEIVFYGYTDGARHELEKFHAEITIWGNG